MSDLFVFGKLALSLTLTVLSLTAALPSQTYDVKPLSTYQEEGALGFAIWSRLNDNDQVVFVAQNARPSPPSFPFVVHLWTEGLPVNLGMPDLPVPPNSGLPIWFPFPLALSDNGHALVRFDDYGSNLAPRHAWWDGREWILLGEPATSGSNRVWYWDIDNLDNIVGSRIMGSSKIPMIWQRGREPSPLSFPSGGSAGIGEALAINDQGWICGYTIASQGNESATVWNHRSGIVADIGHLISNRQSRATKITNSSIVLIETSDNRGENRKYFLFDLTNNSVRSLGTLGLKDPGVSAMNEKLHLLVRDAERNSPSLLWQNFSLVPIEERASPGSELFLIMDLNSSGWLVSSDAFLVTPQIATRVFTGSDVR